MEMLYALPLWYGVFLFSLVFHEAAHAWVARLGGDPTAYLGGQVSLDPLPHIRRERFGMVIVPLISFFLYQGNWMLGWASAPYDPAWSRRYPKEAACMSLAGPASNLLLALFSFAALKTLLASGMVSWNMASGPLSAFPFRPFSFESAIPFAAFLAAGLFLGLFLNFIFFVFNLMPFPPFDGLVIPGLFMTHEGRLKFEMMVRDFSMVGWLLACFLTFRVVGMIWPLIQGGL